MWLQKMASETPTLSSEIQFQCIRGEVYGRRTGVLASREAMSPIRNLENVVNRPILVSSYCCHFLPLSRMDELIETSWTPARRQDRCRCIITWHHRHPTYILCIYLTSEWLTFKLSPLKTRLSASMATSLLQYWWAKGLTALICTTYSYTPQLLRSILNI